MLYDLFSQKCHWRRDKTLSSLCLWGCYTELHSVKSIHGPRNLFRLKTQRFRRFKFSSHIEIFFKSVTFVYPTKNYELLFRSCDHYLITEMADLPYFVFYKWLRLQGISFPFFIHNSKCINRDLLSVCGCACARQRDLKKCGRIWIKFSGWADRLHFEHFIYGGGGTR